MNYTCTICHHENGSQRLHCSTCGTIPAQYSVLGKPSILNRDDSFIEVVIGKGAERIEDRRGRKLYFRTAKLDYFAS